MFVEDYAQKFNQYVRRLTIQERPTDEMLVGYFLNGLRKELKNAVVGVDIAGGLQALVETAQRAEKRFGVSHGKASRRSSKDKRKTRSKREKQSDDSDSNTDIVSKTDMNFDLEPNLKSEEDSSDDSNSEVQIQKKMRRRKRKLRRSQRRNQRRRGKMIKWKSWWRNKEVGSAECCGIKIPSL
ncbi:hypothetical protein L7F22_006031 [Adiantum nelumboides]|nr:hypothetical protein [Adiantum nelumboides]